MSLSVQFLVAAAVVVGFAMIVLANWASERIQISATRGAAEAGAIFLQAFLQPYVQEIPSAGELAPDQVRQLDGLLSSPDKSLPFMMLKIWRLDTSLAYTSNKHVITSESVEDEIRTAAAGGLARHFEELDEEVTGIAPEDNVVLLEVYAPLYKTGTREIIAVGEFYQSAVALLKEQEATRNLTWLVVALITVTMLLILYAIVARGSRTIEQQRQRLEQQFIAASEMADQNNRLRRVAEHARVDASEANESFLSRIGADLHDGPIQTLSLLMLSLQVGRDGNLAVAAPDNGQTSPQLPNTIQLAKSLYGELRNISTGLILPEIQTAPLGDVFKTAISRYEGITGVSVISRISDLPDAASYAVKICAYRIVQEGLTNGYRHADAKSQRVRADVSGDTLRILVSDEGRGFDTNLRADQASLGIVGMQNRVKALKGKLRIYSRPGRGTRIWASLPLNPES